MGQLSEAVQDELGCGAMPVIAIGSHDTASAVVGVPAAGGKWQVSFVRCMRGPSKPFTCSI